MKQQRLGGTLVSRREALGVGASALAVTGLSIAGLVPRAAVAQSAGSPDLMLLNGLLATEYNAIQAYEAGGNVLASPMAGDPLAAVAPVALAVAVHFEGQHRDHAAQLVATIRGYGGSPINYDDVEFEIRPGFMPTVASVLALAANAEKHAALLYITALHAMQSRLSAQLLAAIGGTETQHFIVLSLIAQGIATPTMMTMALANDVVPRSFVVQTASGTVGLEQLPDFAFA